MNWYCFKILGLIIKLIYFRPVVFRNNAKPLFCQASYGEDEDSNDEDAEGNEYPEEVKNSGGFVVT